MRRESPPCRWARTSLTLGLSRKSLYLMDNVENRLNAAIAALECGDTDIAFTLFSLLAEERYPLGQHYLGWCYEQGIGVEKDDKAALELWLQSAKAEIPESLHALGAMYETGRGTKHDVVKAYYWYVRATLAGDEEARMCVEKLKNAMSPLDVSKAESLLNEV